MSTQPETNTDIDIYIAKFEEQKANKLQKLKDMRATVDALDGKGRWTANRALGQIEHIHAADYRAILCAPYDYEKMDEAKRGKVPASFTANGDWNPAQGWNDLSVKRRSLKQLCSWHKKTINIPNIGVVVGIPASTHDGKQGLLAAIDIDCMAPDLVAVFKERFGERFAIRLGNRLRSGMIPVVLTAREDDDTIGGAEVFTSKDEKTHKIQVLQSKQFVAAGMHPSGVLYLWQDASGAEIEMPALANLPSIDFTILAKLLHDNGFSPGSSSAKVEDTRKAELLKILKDADDESFEEVFGEEGSFPLSDLIDANRMFAKVYSKGGGDSYLNDKGEPSHHNLRCAVAKDLLRHFAGLTVVNLKTFFCEWEFAGEYVSNKAAKGQYDNIRIVNAYTGAETAIAGERSGKTKQHDSTRGAGDSFGSVDECDDAPGLVDGERGDLTTEQRDAAVRGADDQLEKVVAAQTLKQMEVAARRAAKFTYLDDLRVAEIEPVIWVVKGAIARNTTSMLVALWGHGKTAVAIDLACHIAAGIEWTGRKVVKGVVVYVGLENAADIKRRIKTWCRRMEDDGANLADMALVVYHAKLGLFGGTNTATQDEKDLIAIAKDASEKYRLPVAAIFIDTLSKSIRPGKEDNDDGAIYVQALQRISDQTGANVTVLAHPSKGGVASSGVRGGGVFEADVDTVLEIVKNDKQKSSFILRADADKFRIGDPGKVNHRFTMLGIVVGRDEDGEDVSVVQAIFQANQSGGAHLGKVDETDGDETDRLLAEAAKVKDTAALNVRIVKDALASLKRQCFDDEHTILRTKVLKEWNTRRGWHTDKSGKAFSSRDTTALTRVLKVLSADDFLTISKSKPVTITLLK